MAVKTITIDMEAYGLLSRLKNVGGVERSFSEVIKAHFAPVPTAGRFKQVVRTFRLSPDALDAMDKVVRDRSKSPVRIVRL